MRAGGQRKNHTRESMSCANYEHLMEFDFDRVAAGWDRWFPVLEIGGRRVSERLVAAARIGPGATVVDIGTGLGEPALTAARAAGEHGRVAGIDISPAMLDLARKRAERERITYVYFYLSDGLSNVPAGSYDAVVSRWGMMFFPDLDLVLRGVLALLRPGGSFTTATWGEAQEVPLISLPLMLMAAAGGPAPDLTGGPFALHDAGDLARRLHAAGFADVSIETFEVVYTFASAGEYFAHVSDRSPTVSALLQRLDDDARAAYRSAVERRLTERFEMPDGTVRIPNRALIASATRPA
jgi:ubiquinone/menaquinone biosynthesis C-methylase UbiE